MAIDVNEAGSEYRNGTAGAGDKLVRKYVKRTDKLAKSTSPEAQANYVAGVTNADNQRRRLTKLKQLSEADLNSAMEQKGAAAYSAGTSAGADKFAKNFAPYAAVIDNTVNALKPRTQDAVSNVMNRVAPLAKALADKKKASG